MGIKEMYVKWKAGAPAREKARDEARARRASRLHQRQRRQIDLAEQKAKLTKQQALIAKNIAEKRKYVQSFRPQPMAGMGAGVSSSSFSMQPSSITQSSYFAKPKPIIKKIKKIKVRKKRRK